MQATWSLGAGLPRSREESVLLMAQACALASGAEEVNAAPLQLEEPPARVLLGAEGEQNVEAEHWYLDTDASNHMTGSRAAFAELDSAVTGTVRFGDNSVVTIAGRGTVLFSCRDGGHRALIGVYFIPRLRSSIISLGQLDERGCQVLIDDGVLQLRDRAHREAAKQEEEVWRWHARFGHISFDALERMAKKDMMRGLPMIKHVGELCDSCLAGKQRRQPFSKKAKFRA
ncbi:hypothetical protein U9M48_001322 [Paspalum notatum var. saurae]|uniref:GAG-pre-integrase domain-containing protein n=1 Tax=Paspalum notatum var. saurae TaxID=547442 RepID=A0AAQ3PLS5_PASNO